MIYQSTRSEHLLASGAEAILQGIASDGGLYVPRGGELPRLSLREVVERTPMALAEYVMGALLPDFAELPQLVKNAYADRFSAEDLTPLVPVGDSYVLELFHGPTSAFKDVALCMLPQLITAAKRKLGVTDEIVILTATSGDTGKAALEGFHDVDGTKIIVFYPEEGVSCVQKAQMVTQEGANVKVCAVCGNFDDAQSAVKQIFAACSGSDALRELGVRLSSANSINIGRLVPQTVYYFKAYGDLVRRGTIQVGDAVDFVVPTGNFGNILAGYLAKKMGLPVGRLVCASNQNDVLTDFLRTGRYDRNRPFHKTISPSMDILISSNLERLLYLETCDTALVSALMQQLSQNGCYQLPVAPLRRIQEVFSGCRCTEAETMQTVREVWDAHGYLMDPHTAVAWYAAQHTERKNPTVVLSTASAYKFPAAVLRALGKETGVNEFDDIAALHACTGVTVPKNLQELASRSVLHSDVRCKEDLLAYVLDQIGE